VLIIGVLRNGLVLNGVSPFAQEFLIGLVIVVAVAIDRWTTRRAEAEGAGPNDPAAPGPGARKGQKADEKGGDHMNRLLTTAAALAVAPGAPSRPPTR
jgi:hypothetical protein